MKKLKRPILGVILIILFMVVALELNTKPQEEYEVIKVTTTMDVQPLIDAGYLGRSGYFFTGTHFLRGPCSVCEAIQSGNMAFTSGLEPTDNFTIITKENSNLKLSLHRAIEGMD